MPHYAAFHLGLHCLPKYMFLGFLVHKGLIVHLHISLLYLARFSKLHVMTELFPWEYSHFSGNFCRVKAVICLWSMGPVYYMSTRCFELFLIKIYLLCFLV